MVQHFSGTCRAARGLETSNLASARILQSLKDSDLGKFQVYDTSNMGMICLVLIGLASLFRLESQHTGEGVLVVVWTLMWFSFILVNSMIVNPRARNKPHRAKVTGMEGHDIILLSNILPMWAQVQFTWIFIFGGTRMHSHKLLTRSKAKELMWRNLNLCVNAQARCTSFKRDKNPYTRINKDHIKDLRFRLSLARSTNNQTQDVSASLLNIDNLVRHDTVQIQNQKDIYTSDNSLSGEWIRWRSRELALYNTIYSEALKVFMDYDTGNKGYLDINNMDSFVSQYWRSLKTEHVNWTPDDVYERVDHILLKLDPDNTGRVHLDVFRNWFSELQIDMGLANQRLLYF
eukprot:gene14096-29992_t